MVPVVHNIEEHKEVADRLASSLAFVVGLDYNNQVCMQGSRISGIQEGTVVVLLLALAALLRVVEVVACNIVVHKMVDS